MNFDHHQLQYWLRDLGAEHATHFELDQDGRCTLRADDNTDVAIIAEQDDNSFAMASVLLPLSGTERERVFSQALSLNFLQTQTRGAAIGLDEEQDALMLFYTCEVSKCEYQEFKNTLDNFVDKTLSLKETLGSARREKKLDFSSESQPMHSLLRV